jgi:methylenetetrahydrofolate reductase (NADPH)
VKISELFEEKKFVFSLEIFPPKKDYSIDSIYSTLEGLKNINPDFISVTYGAGGNPSDNSTCEIAKIIKEKYKIEPLAHLTCVNSSKEQAEDVLDLLEESGIENILALRGDINSNVPPHDDFKYANELAGIINKRGKFNIVGACYPEVHPECPNIETDIENLKYKIEAGVTHLITQLFYDNNDFYNFMYRLRQAGITVPVQAGIMPVTNKKQIERFALTCGASLPKKFVKIMSRYENCPEALTDAGIAYATEQIIDLISNGVEGIHLYTMNKPDVANKISGNINSILKYINNG